MRKKLLLRVGIWCLSQLFPTVAHDIDSQGNTTTLVFSLNEKTLKNSASDILAGRKRK